jgi:hypothetical protein
MTDKIACKKCGELILPSTAEKTAGLCMPCKGNYRRNIEDSKLRHEEQKKLENTPARKHWIWLVKQVYETTAGYKGLSRENQLYFAANIVAGEVYNGGFDQYFTNSSGDFYLDSLEALKRIGALNSHNLLLKAKAVLFGDTEVPEDKIERFDVIQKQAPTEEAMNEKQRQLDHLDAQFYEDPDKFDRLLSSFAEKTGLYSDF